MSLITNFVEFILHIDKELPLLIERYGFGVYLILFLIIFIETGFVVMPFLPGDSLLFAAGTIAAQGSLSIWGLWGLLLIAAIVGDTVNYWIGAFIGKKAFSYNSWFFKKENLEKAQRFYEKHGAKSIVLSRFVPIVRTFAPFTAGISKMHYTTFLIYNVLGGFLWVTIFLFLGYFFGNIGFIKENFHYSIIFIIVISVLPIVYEFIQARRHKVSENTLSINGKPTA